MAAPSLADATMTVGNRIGRYFSVVSMVPSFFLVVWTYALVVSKAWGGEPQLAELRRGLSEWSAVGVAWLVVATLVVALFLHPLQFATTQLLEGYWGGSRVAVGAAKLRILHNRRRYRNLHSAEDDYYGEMRGWVENFLKERFRADMQKGRAIEGGRLDPDTWTAEEKDQHLQNLLGSEMGDRFVVHVVAADAARKAKGRYPEPERILPTRLGNALRSFEDTAGRQYGLDAIRTAPHFFLVAPETHRHYMKDTRQQMDTSIRLCTVSLLATVITVVFLLTGGFWLLVALIPYTLAYIAYRASVAAASEYGVAVRTVMDLDRFALYRNLRIDPPTSTADERATNRGLMSLLDGITVTDVRYSRGTDDADGSTSAVPRDATQD